MVLTLIFPWATWSQSPSIWQVQLETFREVQMNPKYLPMTETNHPKSLLQNQISRRCCNENTSKKDQHPSANTSEKSQNLSNGKEINLLKMRWLAKWGLNIRSSSSISEMQCITTPQALNLRYTNKTWYSSFNRTLIMQSNTATFSSSIQCLCPRRIHRRCVIIISLNRTTVV